MDYSTWISEQTAKRDAERQRDHEVRRLVDAVERDRPPIVFCELPRCPGCLSPELKSERSIDQGDGSRKRWSKCKTCGTKFFLILE